jgi:dienelactone hydrolase
MAGRPSNPHRVGGRRGLLALLLLCSVALWAPPAPAAPPAADPVRPGGHSVTYLDYDAGPAVLAVQPSNGAPIPVDLRGEISVPSGRGPFPVVLLMHGRHGTCAYAGVESLGHPCPATPVTTPVESFRGYRYLAQHLGSHGYLVVSVDANGINTYDTADLDSGALARAELISRTLDLLGSWSTAAGPGEVGTALQGRVDLSRLGLMGHSRGGEGVTRWLAYNRERTDGPRYVASAVFSLAPTDFGNHVVVDRTAYAVLLPRCDGDVSDLQGADVFERSQYRTQAPLHQITVEGANHNWFNSIWRADDSGRATEAPCSRSTEDSARLSIEQQERVGLAWMAAFFRRYVGGTTAFDDLLAGRRPTSAHCAPELPLACHDLVDLSYQPSPPARTTLVAPERAAVDEFLPAPGVTLSASRGLTVTGCEATSPSCPTQGSAEVRSRSTGPQLTLEWERPAALTLTTATSWRGHRDGELVVRLGVNATDEPQVIGTHRARLRLQLTDTRGRSATVRVTPAHGAPEPPPGERMRSLLLSDVRVPLRAFAGVDATALRSIRLLLDDAAGSVQLADLSLQTAEPRPR